MSTYLSEKIVQSNVRLLLLGARQEIFSVFLHRSFSFSLKRKRGKMYGAKS